MVRYGKVVLLNSGNKSFDIIITTDNTGTERIDMIDDLQNYQSFDTSNCVAAYYHKTKEMFYGDEELIKKVLQVRSTASIFHAKKEQKVEVNDGKIVITQEKRDDKLGMAYRLITINGDIDYEYYLTPEAYVEILIVDKYRGLDIQPINLSMYKSYNVVNDLLESSTSVTDYYSLEQLKSMYPIDHIEDNDFEVVTSEKQARERLELFKYAKTTLKAIDTETTGTEIGMYGKDCITGVVLSYNENESTYYPFRQEGCEYNLPISFMQKIINTVNSQPNTVKNIGHNVKFDIQAFMKESPYYIKYSDFATSWDNEYLKNAIMNPQIRFDADTFLLSTLVDPRMQKGLHSLKSLVLKITGMYYLELSDIFKGPIQFNVLPPEIIKYYACPDTANTIKVYKYLIDKLPKDEFGIFNLENKLVYVKQCNEFYGMRTDKKRLVNLLENEEYKIKTLGDIFRGIHRTTKNINSPEVRRDIFYNKLRAPIEIRTKTNLPSTSAEAIKRIVELGTLRDYDKTKIAKPILDLENKVIVKGEALSSNKYPSVVILQAYAKCMKEAGALRRIQRKSLRDRVMFNINQTGAGSGRQTSDAHQYSDAMKSLILADSDDHYLWSSDFSQIELRVLAYVAGEKPLIELEKDMNVDIHRAILHLITGKAMWEISAAERKNGKAVNFGVVYMMSPYGLAKAKAGPKYTKEDLISATNSINDFYNSMPYIKNFVRKNEKFVKKHGYIKTELGRYRYFREILDPALTKAEIESLVRSANNMTVQGFAADYMKIVECNLQNYIIEKGWDKLVDCDGVMLPKVRLMLSIHDEVLVSSHKSIPIEEIIVMFKKCMEIEIEGAPPFFAAPAMVNNWCDGKSAKYEIDLPFRDEIVKAWEKDKTTLLHPETYLEDLAKFRKERLEGYMNGLISKYKTKDEVAMHVNDPELTHTLLDVFIKDGEKLEHHEAIKESVKRYMEDNAIDISTLINTTSEEENVDGIRTYEDLEEYIEFDDKGEVVLQEKDSEWEEEEDNKVSILNVELNQLQTVERSYVSYALSDVIVDLTDFPNVSTAECVNIELSKLSKPNDFYTVVYFIKDKLLRSNIKVGYIPDEINNIVRGKLNKVKGG